MLEYLAQTPNLGLLILRAAIGVIFVVHGWGKLSDLKASTKAFKKMKIQPAGFWALTIGVIELFGGWGIALGLYPEFSAIILVIVMLSALVAVKFKEDFVGGWEFNFLLLAGLLAIALAGPGNLVMRI